MSTLSISAKNLGSLALPDYCPRCSWLRLNMVFKLPYQIFPGIFSSIDSYTKRVVEMILESGQGSSWLQQIGPVEASLPTPHYTKFNAYFEEQDVRLTGTVDALFRLTDGKLCVVDYKTAKFTGHQDRLLPMYHVQLNGYAAIAERLGIGKVSKLCLVYFEPETTNEDAADEVNHRPAGFALGFAAHILAVALSPEKWLTPFLSQARSLSDLRYPPHGNPNCRDCQTFNECARILGHDF